MASWISFPMFRLLKQKNSHPIKCSQSIFEPSLASPILTCFDEITQNFIRMARHKVSRWIIFFIIKAAFLLIVKLNSSCAKKDDRHDIEHPFLASASIKLIPHKKETCFLKIKAASRITRSEICKPFFASKLTAICLRCCCFHNNTKDDLFCNICTFLQCASLLHYLNFS